MNQIEYAARKLCQVRCLDPDEVVPKQWGYSEESQYFRIHGKSPSKEECMAPRWETLVPEVEAALKRIQAEDAVREAIV